MTNAIEVNEVLKTLAGLYTKAQQIKEAIANQEGIVKAYMSDNNLDHICLENGSATWKDVLTKTLDMKAFRQSYENLYQLYAVAKVSKRFTFKVA